MKTKVLLEMRNLLDGLNQIDVVRVANLLGRYGFTQVIRPDIFKSTEYRATKTFITADNSHAQLVDVLSLAMYRELLELFGFDIIISITQIKEDD